MSFQTFCGKDPNDPTTYQKVLKEFLDDTATAVPALNAVLGVGNSASNQSMTDIDDIGCVSIETSKVYAGNFAFVELGEAGDDIKLLGATAKGSIVAGNGVLTKELPVGLNGYVLTANSGAALGVEWAVGGGGGGGVVGVSGGNNISVSGTIPNPVVNLASPLTSTLNMGNQSITDSAASTGTASQYLTAGTGGKTLWATLPSSVASVSAGTNITLTGTATNPIVNLSAPLTSTLNVGSQTISSSTGAIDITPLAASDVNMNVSGTGRVHITQSGTGGATQPAISVENNNGNASGVEIDFYKNSNSPAAADELGIVSFHGNSSTNVKTEYASIKATIVDPNNGSQNGSLALSCCVNSATPSAFLTCDGNLGYIQTNRSINTLGNPITTTTGAINLYQNQPNQNIGLTNVASGGSIIISRSGGGGGVISLNSGSSTTIQSSIDTTFTTGTGVYINQSGSTQPKLFTDIANVNYYPTFVVDNQNLNNVSIPPPAIQGQRLTLINKGITPLSTWNDITAYNLGSGLNASYVSSNGYVWIARVGSNVLEIYDQSLTTNIGNVVFGGSGTQEVFCLLEDSGWMYIGGSFSSINSNATPQVSIARVSVNAPFTEDPIYDSMGTINGVQYGGSVYDIEAYGGYIYFGGNFITFSNGSPAYNIMNISNVGAGTTIFDWCNGGVDSKVYTLLAAGSYLFVGGEFSQVYTGISPVGYSRLATYSGGSGGTWDYTNNNAWNGNVNTLQYTNSGQYIFVGGDFTTPSVPTNNYGCYIDYNAPQSSSVDSGLSISNPLTRGSTFYNGSTWVSTPNNGIYYSSSTAVWVNDGTAQTGKTPSYIGYWSSLATMVVAYTDHTYYMYKQIQSQTATFTLSSGGKFKFNATLYDNATISLRDVGWDFIGDLTSSPYVWRQTSYNPYGGYS